MDFIKDFAHRHNMDANDMISIINKEEFKTEVAE
jgi:hypothetical protein